jgi:hypothetical protein
MGVEIYFYSNLINSFKIIYLDLLTPENFFTLKQSIKLRSLVDYRLKIL